MKKKTPEKTLFFLVLLAMCCVLVAGPCAVMSFAELENNGTAQQGVAEQAEVREDETPNAQHFYAVQRDGFNPMSSLDDINHRTEVEHLQPETEPKEVEWLERYVSVYRVNVYANPSEDAEVVTELIFTDKIEVCPETVVEGWAEVKYGEFVGYIRDNCMLERQEFLDNFQYLLAQVLMCEAGGVSKEEMGKVGEVFLNRLTTTYWEFKKQTTMLGVLSASGQYPGTYRKVQEDILPSEDALEVAEALLLGEYTNQLPDNCYWQTGFDPVAKGWAVKVVDKSYCGNNYYHYYAVPANE